MTLSQEKEAKLVDVSFDIALLLKTIFAAGEVLGGIALFFLTPSRLNGFIAWLLRRVLREDSGDLLGKLLLNFSQHFTGNLQHLAALYLLIHGLIKLITLFLLWKKILWAYPLSVLVFLGFILYQLNEFRLKGSIFMLIVTAIDLMMIVLTLLEYRNMRRAQAK